jgi:uncharacterized repeat protein (TIGR01451 family)
MLAFAETASHAGTPISLYRTFAGNLNYVTTGGTFRTASNTAYNGSACALTSGPISANLSGIPAGSNIRAAYLYWAGSGSTPDYDITFNGNNLSADRTFTENFDNGNSYDFFSGYRDVTSYVTGNGLYSFANLSVDSSSTYCGVQAVLSGWALIVIFQNSSEPLRVVNVYDGFRYFYGSAISLTPTNFRIPASGIDGKHSHITWEGDFENSGSNGGYNENFTFNGTPLTDFYNPSNNQFNSTINTLPSATSYGIDIDTFDVSPFLAPGAGSATTIYSSGADLVLLNAEVLSVTNSAVADLSIEKSHNGSFTSGGTGTFLLTVHNEGPSAATGTAGNPIVVTDAIPAGLTYSSSNGSGWTMDTSSLPTVRWRYVGAVASGADLPPITLQVTVSAAAGSNITNSATVSGPDFDHDLSNNDSSDSVNISFPAGSGNKPLYLYGSGDGYKLSRTPTPGTPGSITLTEGSSRTWSLDPSLQLPSTIDPSVGASVPVALYLARASSFNSYRLINVALSCSSGGATLSQQQNIYFGNTNPALINFSLPLGAAQTCPAGSSWQLTVRNNSSGSGSRNVVVYPVYGGNISQVILPTTTVIKVQNVDPYSVPFTSVPNTTQPATYPPGSQLFLRAVVTDPFGSYDINASNNATTQPKITVRDPGNNIVVNAQPMPQAADSGAASKTFEYAYTIPSGGTSGVWTANVTAPEGTEGTVSDTGGGTFRVLATPLLTIVKSATPSPAINPGQVVTYTVLVTNTGQGSATDVVLTDSLSPYVSWGIAGFTFTDGAPLSSGLTLGTPDFSQNNGPPWGYTPSSEAGGAPAGFDGTVTNWSIPMNGTMNANGANFTLTYTVRVK